MISKALADNLLNSYGFLRSRLPFLLRRPLGYFFYLTSRCNLRCRYCWQREQEEGLPDRYAATQGEMSPQQWAQVTASLPRPAYLGLSGGEATISQAFATILRAAGHGLAVTVNSNGSHLSEEHLSLLCGSSVRNLSISLDGFAQVHDYSRGLPGLFDKVTANIARFNARREGRRQPALTIKTVLLDEGLEDLERFRLFCAEELKAQTLNISLMKTGDHAQFSFQCSESLSEILARRSAALHPYRQPDRVAEVLGRLLQGNRHSTCQVALYPRMESPQQVRQFMEREGRGPYQSCHLPWTQVVVLSSGEVIPCLSRRLGNLRDFGFHLPQLLRQGAYAQFCRRVEGFGGQLPTACHVCCYARVAEAGADSPEASA